MLKLEILENIGIIVSFSTYDFIVTQRLKGNQNYERKGNNSALLAKVTK